ncbi:Uma2 family endonuclease [Argonema galeatum A003/A1]|nr:Uma2 family endonuclease [Argonema galeatum]MCL1463855.1 Uma2 family endonuclease [Argonema galeatum A003/A1]
MYDLPSEDPEEPGLPDLFHLLQPRLLDGTFRPPNYPPEQILVASDLNLYYDLRHTNWYKRPDWYAVVGISRLYEGHDLRSSYVIWQEEVSPFVVVELLSPGTEDEDLGRTVRQRGNPPTKWQVYERILRVHYYIIFSRYTNELQTFRLVGSQYEPVSLTDGRLLIPELGLSLGLWQGEYEGINRLWLRWLTLEGELIPIPREETLIAQQQANAAIARAMEAEERAERLAAKLRELNINPDEV